MTGAAAPSRAGFKEFVAILALCMSLVALAIDAMLPAFQVIGNDFQLADPNATQSIIGTLFAGMALGLLISGPLSDSIGRKNTIYIGLAIFIVGCFLSYFASDYKLLLIGRFIQGLGVAAPRVITTAMVRDRYEGREMGRVMSFIMGLFILVPALAPTIGQGIIMIADWRSIFLVFIGISALLFIWMIGRLEETLPKANRRPFTIKAILSAAKTVFTTRSTVCYTIAAGFIFGAFVGYLNSSQLIFQDYYNVGDWFALYFGAVALAIGVAFFVNAKLVITYGMRYIILRSLIAMGVLAAVFLGLEAILSNEIPLPLFMGYMGLSAFFMGMMFGNFNTLALVPMGHIAGLASAIVGAFSLFIAASAGATIGHFYNDSLMPLTLGFLCLSSLSLLMMFIAEGKKLP